MTFFASAIFFYLGSWGSEARFGSREKFWRIGTISVIGCDTVRYTPSSLSFTTARFACRDPLVTKSACVSVY